MDATGAPVAVLDGANDVNAIDLDVELHRDAGKASFSDERTSDGLECASEVEITVDELATRLEAGAVIVDVRQPDEYTGGHVPGAVLVPLNDVPDRLGELPTEGEVLVVCRTGGRSHVAAEYLIANGVQAVNVAGGTLAWVESGRDVVVGESPA